jgi:hypothetical protein
MNRVKMLEELIGLRVVKSEFVEDYLQIWFEHGECLNVYNQHEITNSERQLAGATLRDLRDDGQFIRLTFSNALQLSIDMSEAGYRGPEAMQLTRPGLPPVVWRPDD